MELCSSRWINRKDVEGKNIFSGGFLGLDNIGVFDRSKPLPTGGFLAQVNTDFPSLFASSETKLNGIRVSCVSHMLS